ncbi:response regulator [candidate division KSB1 bacterium]|nr:response regulator [candidate division KSB1 bacterium]
MVLVEDSDTIRHYYSKVFENSGFEVFPAPTGFEGINHIYEHNPDIILLDLVLPDIQGLDVLKKIRADERFKTTPVIVLTSLREMTIVQKAIQSGANYYSVKGSDSPEKMLQMIYKLIKKNMQDTKGPEKDEAPAETDNEDQTIQESDFEDIEFLKS